MFNTGPHLFEMENWISCSPFEKLLNIKIIKADKGEAVLQMPFLKDYAQGAGLMHGGAIVALADTSVVMAIKSVLPKGSHFATINLSSEFLYPVTNGYIKSVAKIERNEHERIFTGKANVFDENDKEIMKFKSIFKIAKNSTIENVNFKN